MGPCSVWWSWDRARCGPCRRRVAGAGGGPVACHLGNSHQRGSCCNWGHAPRHTLGCSPRTPLCSVRPTSVYTARGSPSNTRSQQQRRPDIASFLYKHGSLSESGRGLCFFTQTTMTQKRRTNGSGSPAPLARARGGCVTRGQGRVALPGGRLFPSLCSNSSTSPHPTLSCGSHRTPAQPRCLCPETPPRPGRRMTSGKGPTVWPCPQCASPCLRNQGAGC